MKNYIMGFSKAECCW